MKFLTEFGPLVAFLIANWKGGYAWGTGVFMAATVIALIVSYVREGHIAKFPLVSAAFVGIFGGLTLYFHDQAFIQVKFTLFNAALGAALLGGLYFNRYYLKYMMGSALLLPDDVWRKMTIRWGWFFAAEAVANEIIRRLVSWDNWLWLKLVFLAATFLFAMTMIPLIARHLEEEPPGTGEGPQGQA